MPDQKTVKRARRDKAEGKAPSTQAGEFVREEMAHIRERKHRALGQAGDRHRALQGAACRREAAGAEDRHQGDEDRLEEGGERGGLSEGAVAPRKGGRAASRSGEAFGGGEEGRPHPRGQEVNANTPRRGVERLASSRLA